MLVLIANPAGASILGTYNDRSTWEAVSTNLTHIDFTSIAPNPGNFQGYNTSAGLTLSDVTFVGRAQDNSTYNLFVLHAPSGAPEDWGSGAVIRGPEWYVGSYFQMTFATGITSFGIDLMSMNPAGASFRVLVDGVDIGGSSITTGSRPNRTFFGLQSDTPLTQIRLVLDTGTAFQTQGLFDNVAFGDVNAGSGGGGGGEDPEPPPAETPEATTLLYAISGIGLMYWARRRMTGTAPV
jgi:hypothetical protein